MRQLSQEHADAIKTMDDLRAQGRITHADYIVIEKAIRSNPFEAGSDGDNIKSTISVGDATIVLRGSSLRPKDMKPGEWCFLR